MSTQSYGQEFFLELPIANGNHQTSHSCCSVVMFTRVKPSDFHNLNVIGKGSFGTVGATVCVPLRVCVFMSRPVCVCCVGDVFILLQVVLARHRQSGSMYAVKVLQKQVILRKKEVSIILFYFHSIQLYPLSIPLSLSPSSRAM